MNRILRNAEKEQEARIKKKMDEENRRKREYEEFLRKQKEREQRHKTKSTLSTEEARELHLAK